jgi:hypothetical protein
MSTYKVLQDIEAEDTLIGPLTVRQCLYAAIGIVSLYLCFICVVKGAAFLVIFLLPFVAFGFFFAFPWSKQQPTEVWALAKVRFYFKPRVRIWNQSGVKELVTITAPKVVRQAYGSNLTPNEVKSRLKALADTIDSRGWAVKNVDLGYYTRQQMNGQQAGSDRLVNAFNMPQEVNGSDVSAAADIFDVQNNPVAQKFDVMMSQADTAHRQQIMQQMAQQQQAAGPMLNQPAMAGQLPAPADYWHMQPSQQPMQQPVQPSAYAQSGQAQFAAQPVQQPVAPAFQPIQTGEPAAAIAQAYAPLAATSLPAIGPVHAEGPGASMAYGTLPTAIGPVSAGYSSMRGQTAQPMTPAPVQPPVQSAVTPQPDPAILELANNNDLNVATLAREAKARHPDPPDEVVVSFH